MSHPMRYLVAEIGKIIIDHQVPIENIYWPRDLYARHLTEAKKEHKMGGQGVKLSANGAVFEALGMRIYQHTGPWIMSISQKDHFFLFEINRETMAIVSYRMFIGTHARKVTTDADVPGASGEAT